MLRRSSRVAFALLRCIDDAAGDRAPLPTAQCFLTDGSRPSPEDGRCWGRCWRRRAFCDFVPWYNKAGYAYDRRAHEKHEEHHVNHHTPSHPMCKTLPGGLVGCGVPGCEARHPTVISARKCEDGSDHRPSPSPSPSPCSSLLRSLYPSVVDRKRSIVVFVKVTKMQVVHALLTQPGHKPRQLAEYQIIRYGNPIVLI